MDTRGDIAQYVEEAVAVYGGGVGPRAKRLVDPDGRASEGIDGRNQTILGDGIELVVLSKR